MCTDLPARYRIILACTGLPPHLGEQGAIDIAEEFTHRPWNQSVRCEWDGSSLVLQAETDLDEEGKALIDGFSDAISACIAESFNGAIKIRSVTRLA